MATISLIIGAVIGLAAIAMLALTIKARLYREERFGVTGKLSLLCFSWSAFYLEMPTMSEWFDVMEKRGGAAGLAGTALFDLRVLTVILALGGPAMLPLLGWTIARWTTHRSVAVTVLLALVLTMALTTALIHGFVALMARQ